MTAHDHTTLRRMREFFKTDAWKHDSRWPVTAAEALLALKALDEELEKILRPEGRCICRNPSCNHADIFHVREHPRLIPMCIVPDCPCGPGGWT